MIDDPIMIIEEYLVLVRSNLPSEIADEVINELRVYIVEAAQEIGQGIMTTDSARIAVSRFGVPSEVAEEYRSSMLLESSEAEETPELKKQRLIVPILGELNRYESLTQVRFLVWVVLFDIVVFLVPIVLTPGHYAFPAIFLESVVFAIFGIILLKLYFRFRRYYIKTIGSTSVFGRRSRVETGVDALISLTLAILPLNAVVSVLRGSQFYYVQITRGHLSYTITGLPIVIFAFAFHASLLLGLLIRGMADLYDLRRSGQEYAYKAIIVSGVLITIGIGMKIGVDVVLIAHSALLYSFNPVLVILACIIAFQILTSHMKLAEKKESCIPSK